MVNLEARHAHGPPATNLTSPLIEAEGGFAAYLRISPGNASEEISAK
jgi:hypothetical protein